MGEEQVESRGPDLGAGVPLSTIPEGGTLTGHARGKPVLVTRRDDRVFAVGAVCTHYGGPLPEGLVVGDTVRCPWHHACFSLRTGEALRAPALKPLARWRAEVRDGSVFVIEELESGDGATPEPGRSAIVSPPSSILIVGAGAAGSAAAEMLRREGYEGPLTVIDPDDAAPYDRPNLSKDYLAGTAPEEWIPLRDREFYSRHGIELVRGVRAKAIDSPRKQVLLTDGRQVGFDRLLLAPGAEPIRLELPGADLPHVRYLRSLADSREIIVRAGAANRAVIIGAGFIGLEVAASLRTRGLEVHLIAPAAQPLQSVLGPELGGFVRYLHERRGVVLHLPRHAAAISNEAVTLDDGQVLPADLVVVGVGVRPSIDLARTAGAEIHRGVLVDEFLQTRVPGIFAVGDIARWPDTRTGGLIRVEHWVVAQRQGQTAARNMLGRRERFDAVSFFWSAHYDTTVLYVGHAPEWDQAEVEGDLAGGEAVVRYRSRGRTRAVATVGRDRAALEAEWALERLDWPAVEAPPAR